MVDVNRLAEIEKSEIVALCVLYKLRFHPCAFLDDLLARGHRLLVLDLVENLQPDHVPAFGMVAGVIAPVELARAGKIEDRAVNIGKVILLDRPGYLLVAEHSLEPRDDVIEDVVQRVARNRVDIAHIRPLLDIESDVVLDQVHRIRREAHACPVLSRRVRGVRLEVVFIYACGDARHRGKGLGGQAVRVENLDFGGIWIRRRIILEEIDPDPHSRAEIADVIHNRPCNLVYHRFNSFLS